MKYFIILSVAILFSWSKKEEDYFLNGKYKTEFKKEFDYQNSTIIFKDSSYSRVFANGKKSNGTIKYWEYFVILKDENSSQIMEIKRSKIKNDEFFVGLKETDPQKSETASYLDINIALGKFTKVK